MSRMCQFSSTAILVNNKCFEAARQQSPYRLQNPSLLCFCPPSRSSTRRHFVVAPANNNQTSPAPASTRRPASSASYVSALWCVWQSRCCNCNSRCNRLQRGGVGGKSSHRQLGATTRFVSTRVAHGFRVFIADDVWKTVWGETRNLPATASQRERAQQAKREPCGILIAWLANDDHSEHLV